MIVSRLLTPGEVGVISIATVLTGIASVIRDFGVCEYLIQEETLTRDKIKAALTANLAISWVLGALLLGGRGVVGDFYHDPRLEDVLLVTAFNLFVIPFGAIPMAWYRREMNFVPLFWSGILATVVSAVVGVGLLLLGVGYMSLAWGSLSGVVTTVAIALWYRPNKFPLCPGVKEIRSVLRFGTLASVIYILRDVGRAAPDLIIGKATGLEAVGLYSRANGFVELFGRLINSAVMPVLLPFFSSADRAGASVAAGYARAMEFLTVIAWPFFGMAALITYPVVRVMYGSQWDAAVPLVRILALAAAVEILSFPAKEALIAVGRIRDSANLQAVSVALRVSGVAAAAPFGLETVCWSMVFTALFTTCISTIKLRKALGFDARQAWCASRKSLLITLCAVSPTVAVVLTFGSNAANYIYVLAWALATTPPTWLAALKLFGHPAYDELSALVARGVKLMVGRYRR